MQLPLAELTGVDRLHWAPYKATSRLLPGASRFSTLAAMSVGSELRFAFFAQSNEVNESGLAFRFRNFTRIETPEPIRNIQWVSQICEDFPRLGVVICEFQRAVWLYDATVIAETFFNEVTEAKLDAMPETGYPCDPEHGLICRINFEDDVSCTCLNQNTLNELFFALHNGSCGLIRLSTLHTEEVTITMGSVYVIWFDTNLGPILCACWHLQTPTNDIIAVGATNGIAVIHVVKSRVLVSIMLSESLNGVKSLEWVDNFKSLAAVYRGTDGIVQVWDLRKRVPLKEIVMARGTALLRCIRAAGDQRFFGVAALNGQVKLFLNTNSRMTAYCGLSLGQEIDDWAWSGVNGLFSMQMGQTHRVFSFDSCPVELGLRAVPNWMAKKHSAAMGIGGRIYICANDGQNTQLIVDNIKVADSSLYDEFSLLETAIEQNYIPQFCNERYETAKVSGEETCAVLWLLLSFLLLEPKEFKDSFLRYLGFDVERIHNSIKTRYKLDPSPDPQVEPSAEHVDTGAEFDRFGGPDEQEDYLALLTKQITPSQSMTPQNDEASEFSTDNQALRLSTNWSERPLADIALLLNLNESERALKLCMSTENYLLALLIAYRENRMDLMQEALKEVAAFFSKRGPGFLLSATRLTEEEIASSCDLHNYKNVLAYFLSSLPQQSQGMYHAPTTNYSRACRILGKRLLESNEPLDSAVCAVASHSVEEFIDLVRELLPGSDLTAAQLILILRLYYHNVAISPRAFCSIRNLVLKLLNYGLIPEASRVLNLIRYDPQCGQLSEIVDTLTSHSSRIIPCTIWLPAQQQEQPAGFQSQNNDSGMSHKAGFSHDNSNFSFGIPTQTYNKDFSTAGFNAPPNPFNPGPQLGMTPGAYDVGPGSAMSGNAFSQPPHPPMHSAAFGHQNSAVPQTFNNAQPTTAHPPPPSYRPPPMPMQGVANAFSQSLAPPPLASERLNSMQPPPMSGNFGQQQVIGSDRPPQMMGINSRKPSNCDSPPPTDLPGGKTYGIDNRGQSQINAFQPTAIPELHQSTHPANSVGLISPKLPVPWPIPTSSQMKSVGNINAERYCKVEQLRSSPKTAISPELLAQILTAVSGLVRNPKYSNTKGADTLMSKLEAAIAEATMSDQDYRLLLSLAESLQSEVPSNAMTLLQRLSDNIWSKTNREWLSTFKAFIKVTSAFEAENQSYAPPAPPQGLAPKPIMPNPRPVNLSSNEARDPPPMPPQFTGQSATGTNVASPNLPKDPVHGTNNMYSQAPFANDTLPPTINSNFSGPAQTNQTNVPPPTNPQVKQAYGSNKLFGIRNAPPVPGKPQPNEATQSFNQAQPNMHFSNASKFGDQAKQIPTSPSPINPMNPGHSAMQNTGTNEPPRFQNTFAPPPIAPQPKSQNYMAPRSKETDTYPPPPLPSGGSQTFQNRESENRVNQNANFMQPLPNMPTSKYPPPPGAVTRDPNGHSQVYNNGQHMPEFPPVPLPPISQFPNAPNMAQQQPPPFNGPTEFVKRFNTGDAN